LRGELLVFSPSISIPVQTSYDETLVRSSHYAVCCASQIYPENAAQAAMLSEEAMKVGFTGGLVIDYPHSTRAKKYYLCLMVGAAHVAQLPAALADGGEVSMAGRARSDKKQKSKGGKDRSWVLKKKEQMRGKGNLGVAPDTKYTARKRKDRF
jgi:18S rRNA (guanine1575-N7)-methyltransferase